jgi:DNA-binding response OmpR family regulator
MNARILVVDDESDIAALVAYNLARAGYRVSTARSGTEALKAAMDEKPDVVILDLMLPDFTGFEVLARLREQSETRDVGVILLTARDNEGDRVQGLSLGADDYIASHSRSKSWCSEPERC